MFMMSKSVTNSAKRSATTHVLRISRCRGDILIHPGLQVTGRYAVFHFLVQTNWEVNLASNRVYIFTL